VTDRIRRPTLSFIDADHRRHTFFHGVDQTLNRLEGDVFEVKCPPSANQEFAIKHPGRKEPATEFSVIVQDAPGRLYRSSPARWTADASYFKYDQAGGTITVRLR
jgi:hypothetical protein